MDGLDDYRHAWARRSQAEVAQAAARRARAEALLPTLVHALVQTYDARRVVLIGSLARGAFGARSDIDLVVEGIAPARFFEAAAALDRLADPIRVDLIPLETAQVALYTAIEADGRILHDT